MLQSSFRAVWPSPHVVAYLEPVDEGHEQLPLEAIFVQCIWRSVAGGHQDQAVIPQTAKQAVEDHGICHICHKQLVKCQHLRQTQPAAAAAAAAAAAVQQQQCSSGGSNLPGAQPFHAPSEE
jgi:hypothetical protein